MAKQAAKPAAKKAVKTTATKSSASASSKPPAKKTSSPKKPQVAATKSSAATAAKPAKERGARSPATATAAAASVSVEKPKYSGPARVCADHQRRTCIELSRDDIHVEYIALDVEGGLDVSQALLKEFDGRFKPLVDYPVEKAAALYVEYARGLGATERAMKQLGTITNVNTEDMEMAAKKKAARAAAPVKTEKKSGGAKAATKSASKAASTPSKTNGKSSARPTTKTSAKKEGGGRGPTAASRFQELLMEKGSGGKCAHTDDQIFAKVQKEFGLDDSKRSYVKWYRNYLGKQGKNPPAAKE